MSPREVAERYFTCIRAKDVDGLMALYADDAVFTLPNGKQFAGLAAIRGMHESVLAASTPTPTPLAMVESADAIAVEIEARLPDGNSRRTANFYHLNAAGKVQRLSVYMQGG